MNMLSEQLRKRRMEKGLQAKEMAYALKIEPSTYSRIENGQTKMTVDIAKQIAEVLQIPMSELLDNKEGKYQIKNGNNSPLAIENSTVSLQNEKLINAILKLVEQQTKANEQQILIMQNQNELFKEFSKNKK